MHHRRGRRAEVCRIKTGHSVFSLEHFRLSPNRESALTFCFYAIPDAKPLSTFAGIALAERRHRKGCRR
ncbi:hypothetical protein DEM27_27195 [Metarhizobium album]|uniref:Uncharacterized protein n=1 Tax=Metarhizobium album TaxID=2182425 RepID=A0A2U2DID9_9HYPH|nr:hypothetical protein DEM27_27195 [Rhizobium album]